VPTLEPAHLSIHRQAYTLSSFFVYKRENYTDRFVFSRCRPVVLASVVKAQQSAQAKAYECDDSLRARARVLPVATRTAAQKQNAETNSQRHAAARLRTKR
jgi:hypothetical protein